MCEEKSHQCSDVGSHHLCKPHYCISRGWVFFMDITVCTISTQQQMAWSCLVRPVGHSAPEKFDRIAALAFYAKQSKTKTQHLYFSCFLVVLHKALCLFTHIAVDRRRKKILCLFTILQEQDNLATAEISFQSLVLRHFFSVRVKKCVCICCILTM